VAIDEIEVQGTSISLRCWKARIDDPRDLLHQIMTQGDQFTIEPEAAGFHDCDAGDRIVRGFYSGVIPFEVEHLVDGISTKTLMKRIETCEFIALPEMVFTMGRSGPQKGLSLSLSGLTGFGVSPLEFEFHQLSQFNDRLSQVKAIVLTNPKDREVRRARLAGIIENYTEYNVIDPRNHGIDSVSGLADTPLGPLTVTATAKGGIRIGVKRGFILTIECLEWLVRLIREEKPPQPAAPAGKQ
jgi:hypothetical protein